VNYQIWSSNKCFTTSSRCNIRDTDDVSVTGVHARPI